MNPKPFASLNHFTVPVAISSNSLSTRYKRDVARPMFRSQGKYGGRTTAWRSYRACLYCLEQNTADTIRQISRKSDNFPLTPRQVLHGIPRQTRDSRNRRLGA